MRGLLLAAALDATTTTESYWEQYRSSTDALAGLHVHDPFMGGGSTLIEGARLGGEVSGTDVDATAVAIVSHCLAPSDAAAVSAAGAVLLAHLRMHFGSLYSSAGGEPLHYFHVPVVTCPDCGSDGALYRSLVLARDCGKPGAVVRDSGATVFDPETFEIFQLSSATQENFQGSSRSWSLDSATYQSFRYCCPCGKRSSHRDLQTGSAATRLVAVERTPADARRVLCAPTTDDLCRMDNAKAMLNQPPVPLRLPTAEFEADRADPRPRSFGIKRVRDLFTPRQLLVLGAASAWIDGQKLAGPVDRALRLALSNALATNNRLCSYATDYGRLSALFSVRGYSLPALAVELNPLHSNAGRGTLQQCIGRVASSAQGRARRAFWNVELAEAEIGDFTFSSGSNDAVLHCTSAADDVIGEPVDLLVFDPPYYDYIIYDELAELFRAWNPDMGLGGVPLQTSIGKELDDFGVTLAECLRPALEVRRARYPIVFTYHSSHRAAWDAIGTALDEAKLRVTALWPIRSDGHMGHHSHPGNCEWDVIVVCRPVDETVSDSMALSRCFWTDHVGDFAIGEADLRNFTHAQGVASSRFGRLTERIDHEASPNQD
jgi:adenine-specific DNA methylase